MTSDYTFMDMAFEALEGQRIPLTIDQLWDLAVNKGLVAKLAPNGKTPSQTLGARLYVDVKRPDSKFQKIGSYPATFLLKSTVAGMPEAEIECLREIDSVPSTPSHSAPALEKHLHPHLVYFAFNLFGAHCKTINHSKSKKAGQKSNEWLHPDIVGFVLETEDWKPETVKLFGKLDNRPITLYSFELKMELGTTDLRASFFQAVSNSSWAHEGYLVAAKVSNDKIFLEELERLSSCFGIGVTRLDTREPDQSEIMFPARRNSIDWKTVDRLVDANSDFKEFVSVAEKSAAIHQVFKQGLDKVPSEENLLRA